MRTAAHPSKMRQASNEPNSRSASSKQNNKNELLKEMSEAIHTGNNAAVRSRDDSGRMLVILLNGLQEGGCRRSITTISIVTGKKGTLIPALKRIGTEDARNGTEEDASAMVERGDCKLSIHTQASCLLQNGVSTQKVGSLHEAGRCWISNHHGY